MILNTVSSFDDVIISYMDDLWIFSDPINGLKGHLPVIRLTFMALKRAGVLLGPKKCTFYTQDFKVLGVSVNSKNSELDLNEKKANAILLWTRPNSLSELQSRIFSLNYCGGSSSGEFAIPPALLIFPSAIETVKRERCSLFTVSGVSLDWTQRSSGCLRLIMTTFGEK